MLVFACARAGVRTRAGACDVSVHVRVHFECICTRYLFPFFVKFQYLVTMAALDVNVQLTDKQKHWAVEEVFGMLLVRMHAHTFTHKMTHKDRGSIWYAASTHACTHIYTQNDTTTQLYICTVEEAFAVCC